MLLYESNEPSASRAVLVAAQPTRLPYVSEQDLLVSCCICTTQLARCQTLLLLAFDRRLPIPMEKPAMPCHRITEALRITWHSVVPERRVVDSFRVFLSSESSTARQGWDGAALHCGFARY